MRAFLQPLLCGESSASRRKSFWKRHMMCTKAPGEYRWYCIVQMMIIAWIFPAMAFHGDWRLWNASRFRFWVWKPFHILSLYLWERRSDDDVLRWQGRVPVRKILGPVLQCRTFLYCLLRLVQKQNERRKRCGSGVSRIQMRSGNLQSYVEKRLFYGSAF